MPPSFVPDDGRRARPSGTGPIAGSRRFKYSSVSCASRSGQIPSARAPLPPPAGGRSVCPASPRSNPARSCNGADTLREERLITHCDARHGRAWI